MVWVFRSWTYSVGFVGLSKSFRTATPARQQRVAERVAPLVVQGKTVTEICAAVGINRETARHDIRLCKQMWLERHDDSRDEWRGRILATYEWMLKECADAWQQSKEGRVTRVINPDGTEMIRQEPPDPRWLSGMLAVAKETSTFLGIREGADQISRVEVPAETRAALAPMTPDAYLAMLNASGGLSALNAVPPVDRRPDPIRAQEVETVTVECMEPAPPTPGQQQTPPTSSRFIPRPGGRQ